MDGGPGRVVQVPLKYRACQAERFGAAGTVGKDVTVAAREPPACCRSAADAVAGSVVRCRVMPAFLRLDAAVAKMESFIVQSGLGAKCRGSWRARGDTRDDQSLQPPLCRHGKQGFLNRSGSQCSTSLFSLCFPPRGRSTMQAAVSFSQASRVACWRRAIQLGLGPRVQLTVDPEFSSFAGSACGGQRRWRSPCSPACGSAHAPPAGCSGGPPDRLQRCWPASGAQLQPRTRKDATGCCCQPWRRQRRLWQPPPLAPLIRCILAERSSAGCARHLAGC